MIEERTAAQGWQYRRKDELTKGRIVTRNICFVCVRRNSKGTWTLLVDLINEMFIYESD